LAEAVHVLDLAPLISHSAAAAEEGPRGLYHMGLESRPDDVGSHGVHDGDRRGKKGIERARSLSSKRAGFFGRDPDGT
jgi:hypothetical protein